MKKSIDIFNNLPWSFIFIIAISGIIIIKWEKKMKRCRMYHTRAKTIKSRYLIVFALFLSFFKFKEKETIDLNAAIVCNDKFNDFFKIWEYQYTLFIEVKLFNLWMWYQCWHE